MGKPFPMPACSCEPRHGADRTGCFLPYGTGCKGLEADTGVKKCTWESKCMPAGPADARDPWPACRCGASVQYGTQWLCASAYSPVAPANASNEEVCHIMAKTELAGDGARIWEAGCKWDPTCKVGTPPKPFPMPACSCEPRHGADRTECFLPYGTGCKGLEADTGVKKCTWEPKCMPTGPAEISKPITV